MSIRACCLPLALLALVACASTDDEAPAEPVDWDAVMATFVENSQPSAGHRALDPLVGTFAATTTVSFDPQTPPEVTNGTCTNQWSLDGRFLEMHYEGTMMGMPFVGRGFYGHDNTSGEYASVWVDSMTTDIMPVARGTANDDATVITTYRTAENPMTGVTETMREVTTIHGEDHHTYEMFVTPEGGTESRSLHIDYVRL